MGRIDLVLAVGYRTICRVFGIHNPAVVPADPDDDNYSIEPVGDSKKSAKDGPADQQSISTVGTNFSNLTGLTKLSSQHPKNQAQLDTILKLLASATKDEFGMNRLYPDLNEWFELTDRIPIIIGGTYIVQNVQYNSCRIYESDITTVYNVIDYPEIVVRYHVHWDSALSPIDTTVVDFWFLRQLAGTGLVAKVYYFSAPLDPNHYDHKRGRLIESGANGKTKTTLGPKPTDKPGVRYMVMEKVGQSVQSYFRSRVNKCVPFEDAIRMGGQMITLLEKLHAFNFIHGDAHMGNFAIKDNRLIFIDFGHGRIIDRSELSDKHEASTERCWCHPWLSVWEMHRYQASFRDDVYRVLQGLAMIIHGQGYFKFMEHLYSTRASSVGLRASMRQRFVDIKESGGLFEIPPVPCDLCAYPAGMPTSFSLVGKVPEGALVEVRKILSSIMTALLAVPIEAKPDYAMIKRGFARVLRTVAAHAENGECSGRSGKGCSSCEGSVRKCEGVEENVFQGSFTEAAYEELFQVNFLKQE